MGKGNGTACNLSMDISASGMGSGEWSVFLERELGQLLKETELIDGQAGEAKLEELLETFASSSPKPTVASVGGSFRVMLAGLLVNEGDSTGAVQLLSHSHVEKESAGELLSSSIENADIAPVDRSRYRHALAELMFDKGDTEGAIRLLEEDCADPKVLPARHGLARRKIEALSDFEPPQSWLHEIMPGGFSDPASAAASIDKILLYGVDSRKGFEEATNLSFKLSEQGFTSEALKLSRAIMEAQEGGSSARPFIAQSGYAGALVLDGRPDEAASLLASLAESQTGETRRSTLEKLKDLFDEAGLDGEALKAARVIRDEADSTIYRPAQEDLVSRLVAMGRFTDALEETERADPSPSHDPFGERSKVLEKILHASPPPRERSFYRRQMAQLLLQEGEPSLAEDVLQADVDDPEVSAQDKQESFALLENL